MERTVSGNFLGSLGNLLGFGGEAKAAESSGSSASPFAVFGFGGEANPKAEQTTSSSTSPAAPSDGDKLSALSPTRTPHRQEDDSQRRAAARSMSAVPFVIFVIIIMMHASGALHA